MRALIFFLIITLCILVVLFFLLRAGRLKEKYAAIWALVGVACLVLVVFPRILTAAAHLVGIQVASNLLFALSILLVLGLCLQLSLEASSQEDKIRRLAEEVAILRTTQSPGPAQSSPRQQPESPAVGVDGSDDE